ncbi:MAG: protein-S-isoprenylcysteine O-methyltransferase Ste14 [Moritella dasanensis]|jgi:protein-S-isoprenylcysteine O-methyltransferase Ste14
MMKRLENKIPPPIITLFFAVIMWGCSLLAPSVEMSLTLRLILSLVLIGLGIFFAIAGVVSFKKAATTVNPLKPETASLLVTSGVYKYSRNPMYVGLVLLLLAWNVYLSTQLSLFGIMGFMLYMNRYQIKPEESALTTLFGREFTTYQAQVRRWL